MPQTPSIGKLCMLIVLCTITSYSQSKAHFICVTMPDLENPLENCLWAWCILNSYACVSLIVHPPFGIPGSAPDIPDCLYNFVMLFVVVYYLCCV